MLSLGSSSDVGADHIRNRQSGPASPTSRHTPSGTRPPDPARSTNLPRLTWLRSASSCDAPARAPTAVDLFCGAGGLSLGLERAGLRRARRRGLGRVGGADPRRQPRRPLLVRGSVGSDGVHQHARRCGASTRSTSSPAACRVSRSAAPGRSRIRELVEIGRARDDDDPRADLWGSFIAVVEQLDPAAVLVENVPDLPRWDDGAVLIGLYESLRELGYRVEARILDGFRHGVPQHRQRLILIGLRRAASSRCGREP